MKASRILFSLAGLALLLAGGIYAYALSKKPLLEVGVAYGARVACGCRFMGNRPLADCTKDFEPGMEMISLKEDAATKTVTAYVPLLVSRSATYDPVLGCQPEKLAR